MILSKSINVIATILAKNESDIIGKQIEHHLEQGISRIIFTDNNSTDNTKEIASKYPEIILIEEFGDDHNQSKWVSHMAQIAFKLKPDWIVHLDADEFWFNFQALKYCKTEIAKCERMYMHLPQLSYYLDFDHIPIAQECKIAHRPIEGIVINHGNHGVQGNYTISNADVFRHHFPIRSFEQWENKKQGHYALEKRSSICERWKQWTKFGKSEYDHFCSASARMIKIPNFEDLEILMNFWGSDFVPFKQNQWMPKILSKNVL